MSARIPGRAVASGPGKMQTAPNLIALLLCASLVTLGQPTATGAEVSTREAAFFENRIRPLLVQRCHECHGPEKQKAHLRLDSLDALLTGGESGPAVVPGQPAQSRLISAVRYTDPDLQMPPKTRLSDREVADLTEWVRLGAPWPIAPAATARTTPTPPTESGATRPHWAFQSVRKPAVPVPSHSAAVRNPIDAFIDAELERRGLRPNPPASRRELIRRATFDLTGLPPTYEQVRAFEADPSSEAYERLLDDLLARPQYGERWGRHWLDVVRFGQSTGYERDAEKPLAWRYRDYVINSLNADKSYRQFVLEQLAGDELDRPTAETVAATGFYRLGVWDDEPADKQMAEYDEYDDYISTTGAAFLGLTLGCARCHEHKFDPIPQSDYYAFLAFFRNVRGYEGPKFGLESAAYAPLAGAEEVRAWQRAQAARIEPLEASLAQARLTTQAANDGRTRCELELAIFEGESATTAAPDNAEHEIALAQHLALVHDARELARQRAAEQQRLQKELDQAREAKPAWEWALAVKEHATPTQPTHLLIRGNPLNRGAEVQPAFLSALGGGTPKLPPQPHADATFPTGGRRRALAEWIASPDNPLTPRVLVNRVWKHHFGTGLVRTTTDFGRAGSPPTHPALLDWLAAVFIEDGWSLKQLHKRIMLSDAYQRSSRAAENEAATVDPANALLWRQNFRRLEAEAIRDAVLSTSGQLNLKAGGRGFFPRLAGEVIAGASRPGLDWEISPPEEQARRSVYIFVKRSMLAPALQSFDYSTTDSPLGERPVTTVAPQALLLLNDSFLKEQASAFAGRVIHEAGSVPVAQVRRAYQIALARDPSGSETSIALGLLDRQTQAHDRIRSRITFRPDVPESIYRSYQEKLQAADHLIGPGAGWTYHRGEWSREYEGIRTVNRAQAPFALWKEAEFADGSIQAGLLLHRAAEFGSILFRASATNELQTGYELVLEPREQQLVLRRHDPATRVLARAPAAIRAGEPQTVRIDVCGADIGVWLDGGSEPVLRFHDPTAAAHTRGRVGVRAWGAALSLDQLRVDAPGLKTEICGATRDRDGIPSSRHALESLCLTLLNLNELVYVD